MIIDLSGKVIMITAGADKAGRIISLEFAKSGADIVAACLPEQKEEAQRTAAEVEALGRRCLILELDLREISGMKEAVRKVEDTFGRLDGLILNTSFKEAVDFDDMTADNWDMCDAVIAKSAAFLCREAAELMMKNKYGRIISIGDSSFYENDRNLVAHSSAECSLAKLMMGLAVYYAPYIKCNALNMSRYFEPEDGMDEETKAPEITGSGEIITVKGRRWQSNDIYGAAELLQFLIGCRNSCGISGATIPVDNAMGLMSFRNW